MYYFLTIQKTQSKNLNKRHQKYVLIRKGVRKGCSLSHLLFNILIESAMKMFKTKSKVVKINGKLIHSIRFANDITIVAENNRDLGNMLTILLITFEHVLLKINTKKQKH